MSLPELITAEKNRLYNIEAQLQYVERNEVSHSTLSDTLDQSNFAISNLEQMATREPASNREIMKMFGISYFVL